MGADKTMAEVRNVACAIAIDHKSALVIQCNCITLWLVENRSDQENLMAKVAEVLEIPATVTERGQTTVPAAIRKMLNLGKRAMSCLRHG